MRHLALHTTRKRLSRLLTAGGTGLALLVMALPATTGSQPAAAAGSARADETTISQNSLRSGWDSSETAMSPTDVQGFSQLFKTEVIGQVWAQPLVVNGTLIVATEKDFVYGLDPATGAVKWRRKLGTFYHITTCNDLSPDVGVTGGPVYDPGTNAVYVMAQIKPTKTPLYSLFGINPDTGAITESIGVPLHPSNAAKLTFSGTNEMARPGLLDDNGWVYAAFGSHCDHKPYVGYVAGFNVASKARTMWADETGSANNQAGIWMGGGGLMSDGTGRIFFASGNGVSPGPGYPAKPPAQLAESVVRLGRNASGTLSAKDFFSPSNAPKLDSADTDWGSGSPIGLPEGTSTYPNVLAQVGKDGRIFLLNRSKLGGRNATSNAAALSVSKAFAGEWGHPAVYFGSTSPIVNGADDYLYYIGKKDTLRYFRFGATSAGKPRVTDIGNTTLSFGYSSGSPAVTSNGTGSAGDSSAVVWAVNAANSTGAGGELDAFPATPAAAGWPSGCTSGCTVSPIKTWKIGTASKFSNIATDNGRVYVGTRLGVTSSDGSVYGFGTPPPSAAVKAAPQATFSQTPVKSASTTNVTLTANSTLTVTGVTASTQTTGTPADVGSPVPSQFAAHSGSTTLSPATGGRGRAAAKPVRFPVTLHKGQQLTVPVTFSPSSPGGATGTVTFATSAGPQDVALAGTGTTAGLYPTPPAVQFALVDDTGQFASNVPVGVQVPRQFDIVNGGTKPVRISSVSPPGGPYQVTSGPAAGTVLKPGQSTVVQIEFTPATPGSFPASYSVTGSDGTTATVSLTGVGLPATGLFKASPSSVNFGAVPVGQQKTAVITLTNSGNEPATVVTTSTLTGPFRRVVQMAPALPVNASYQVRAPIAFAPKHKGTFTTTYTFTWADVTGTHSVTVKLTGTGV